MISKYKRVLLKISGEALMGEQEYGIHGPTMKAIAQQISEVVKAGVEVGVVVGGGNVFRGSTAAEAGMDRATADYMGMLATLLNALALQDALEREGVVTRTLSALEVRAVAEPYIRRRAIRHLEKGRVVLFACGTGNPYMTTDTAAALRAIEIGAEVLLMAKNKVDGVYDADPLKYPGAKKFDRITHRQALDLRLEIMDATAFALCMENSLPVIVFDLQAPAGVERALSGQPIGTLVSS